MRKKVMYIAFALGASLLFSPCTNAESTETPQNAQTTTPKKIVSKPIVKNKNSISVPGFGQINLVADQLEQTTRLYNPEQNNCYFKISIVLSDGTVVWKSDFMAPGEKADKITLLKSLPEGTYNDVAVRYDCFSMNKQSGLNNAQIKLKLVVKK